MKYLEPLDIYFMCQALGTNNFDPRDIIHHKKSNLLSNGHLAKPIRELESIPTDKPRIDSGIANPDELTWVQLIARAKSADERDLLWKVRREQERLLSQEVLELIWMVWDGFVHACYGCFRGGLFSSPFYGIRLCFECEAYFFNPKNGHSIAVGQYSQEYAPCKLWLSQDLVCR